MATVVKTLSGRLAEAEAAYHELSIGKSPVEFRDQNGEHAYLQSSIAPKAGCIRGEPSASRGRRDGDKRIERVSQQKDYEMKNYIQPGDNIEVIAPSAIDSGELVKVGQIFGVATADAANGDPVVISTRGVFRMSKLSNDNITAGARLYRHASGANAGRLTDFRGCRCVGGCRRGSGGRERLDRGMSAQRQFLTG